MTNILYKVEPGTSRRAFEASYFLLTITALPKAKRKLAKYATLHRRGCHTCRKYLYKHYNQQYGRRHCWSNLERHLIAKHGYDPRPWYMRMFWWTHPVIPGISR